jgi:hypothetical protein
MVRLLSKLNPFSSGLPKKLKSKISYRVELNFRLLALAMYTDENKGDRIARFYSNSWYKEVLVSLDANNTLKLKTFINTACLNLSEPGLVRLLIAIDDKTVAERSFEVVKAAEHSGWYEIVYTL